MPAARRALAILRTLAGSPTPVTAATLARDLGLPRSSTYHLLAAMAEDGFVVHYPEEQRWGIGVSAFELGTAYLRHDPLERQARPVLRALVTRLPHDLPAVAHCGVLRGRETLYVATESTALRVSVVAEVGVRLPASLTVSGRCMLAVLPAAQVRALFPDRDAFVVRTGRGPSSLAQLRALLATERRAGVAVEDGMVTEGYASVAAASVDRAGRPVASIGVTVRSEDLAPPLLALCSREVRRTAGALTRRWGAVPAPT
ncbi:MAG: IclR family transcriptional regulator [Candidatus Nanopelagicales bacterium]